MKKILITGANGFLGSHLVQDLKDEFHLVGLVREINKPNRAENQTIEMYSSESSLEKLFEENAFFAVIHAATIYSKKEDFVSPLINTNIVLPVRLAELCAKYKVDIFLNTDSFFNNESSSYSYLSEYTLTKKHALDWLKLLAKEGTFKLVNMKIFHMYGEKDSNSKFVPFLISELQRNLSHIKMTAGTQKRDFIYVSDVVSAFKKVLASANNMKTYQEYEVGTGVVTSIKDFAELVKNIVGSQTELLFGAIETRKGEIMESCADTTALLNLGWKPKHSLETGLRRVIPNKGGV